MIFRAKAYSFEFYQLGACLFPSIKLRSVISYLADIKLLSKALKNLAITLFLCHVISSTGAFLYPDISSGIVCFPHEDIVINEPLSVKLSKAIEA